MIFTETKLKGAGIIELKRREDERGFFARSLARESLKSMSNEPGQALREHPGACSTDPATRIGDHIGTELAEFDRCMDEVVGLASGTRRQRVRILARFLVPRFESNPIDLGSVRGIDLRQLQREEPDTQWKAAAFARWHEPDDRPFP